MFRKKSVKCPSGQWTTIIRSVFTQMPGFWEVKFNSEEGGEVQGQVVESKSAWVFPQEPQTLPLQPRHQFRRGYWNTFYSVRVNPTTDITAEID